MRLSALSEATWIKVIGGANSNAPGYSWPLSHPHEVLVAPGLWLHGTSDRFLDSIMDNGLRPANNLHLTQSRKLAVFSARRAVERFGGGPVILTVSVADLDLTLVGTSVDSSTVAVIPSRAIVRVQEL